MDIGCNYKVFVLFALENEEGSLYRGLKAFQVIIEPSLHCIFYYNITSTMKEEGICFDALNTLCADSLKEIDTLKDKGLSNMKVGHQVGYVACDCELSEKQRRSLQQRLQTLGASFAISIDASSEAGICLFPQLNIRNKILII